MKKPSLHSKFPAQITRILIDIASLVAISLFFVFTPSLGKLPGPVKPVVKAAYVSQPSSPISSDLTPPEITASGVLMIDLDSNIILYEKNPNLRLKPASLTKIMTSLVSLDYFSDDSVITVKNGHNSLGKTVDLIKGDILTADDLLYALLVPSGNDAAVTLAENYPGGYGAFLDQMNQKTVNMGLKDTHFANVSGVESPDHYTTAFDILVIARNALLRPKFASIVSTKNITVQSLKGRSYTLVSTNILLGKSGILGVKTGWTPEARECLVILAENNGHRILLSLLNSEDRFGEAEALVKWAFKNYTWL